MMVARRQNIDWDDIYAWAANEGINDKIIDEIRDELDLVE
jgi:hypothetical protein